MLALLGMIVASNVVLFGVAKYITNATLYATWSLCGMFVVPISVAALFTYIGWIQ